MVHIIALYLYVPDTVHRLYSSIMYCTVHIPTYSILVAWGFLDPNIWGLSKGGARILVRG